MASCLASDAGRNHCAFSVAQPFGVLGPFYDEDDAEERDHGGYATFDNEDPEKTRQPPYRILEKV